MFCPICNKPADQTFKPFCSDRCKMLDLGKWLKGDYTVPVVEMDDMPDDEPQDENDK